jgi:predicted AAA+ superfamily ATPase
MAKDTQPLKLNKLFRPYNPWWARPDGKQISLFPALPEFHRPIFQKLYEDLQNIPQMLSITGPRRVGKSTLLRQMIQRLLSEGIPASRLLYYSFDDPALATSKVNVDAVIDDAMKAVLRNPESGPTYLFLDEIHKLDRWELYLKKYYDLEYPIRVIVSGSASSPIFKKSRESLLGRVKDYHLLPFSFREFVLFRLRDNPEALAELDRIYEKGKSIQDMLTEAPGISVKGVGIEKPSETLQLELEALLDQYLLEGGFPEVWRLPTWVAKQEYLYDNQVKKVIYEDLVFATEFRKPELLKRFYISLLERPGQEVAVQAVSQETAINSPQIEKYIPLLEMTDLVYRIPKYRSGALRVRRGMMKFYLVDLALRNAALRLNHTALQDDDAIRGLYAENLVFLALRKWRGTVQMDYFREKDKEVDFIVHLGPRRHWPVEVKYRNQIKSSDARGIEAFMRKCPTSVTPVLVTKHWRDLGIHHGERIQVFHIPLILFLLLFD